MDGSATRRLPTFSRAHLRDDNVLVLNAHFAGAANIVVKARVHAHADTQHGDDCGGPRPILCCGIPVNH